MVSIYPLFSSSSGNCFCISTDNENILIDIGVTYKSLCSGLKIINKEPSNIDAVLITHEHSDHIKGLPVFYKNNPNVKIYSTIKTIEYIKELLLSKNIEFDDNNFFSLEYGQVINLCDNFKFKSFETSHDAVMPCGYDFEIENRKVCFATDLGYISDEIFDMISGSNFSILESNYDKTMLEFGKYPFEVKRRIKGIQGHLSNDDTANAILDITKNQDSSSNNFLLAHLSYNNNTIDIARDTIYSTLSSSGIDPLSVNINFATKDMSNEVYVL